MIRFWNTTTGTKVGELKCDAQVTNLGWSTTSDEIVSTHGYANDNHIPGQISVWVCTAYLYQPIGNASI